MMERKIMIKLSETINKAVIDKQLEIEKVEGKKVLKSVAVVRLLEELLTIKK